MNHTAPHTMRLITTKSAFISASSNKTQTLALPRLSEYTRRRIITDQSLWRLQLISASVPPYSSSESDDNDDDAVESSSGGGGWRSLFFAFPSSILFSHLFFCRRRSASVFTSTESPNNDETSLFFSVASANLALFAVSSTWIIFRSAADFGFFGLHSRRSPPRRSRRRSCHLRLEPPK